MGTTDAIELLLGDHRAIRTLFAEYEAWENHTAGAADRHALVARLGTLLRTHAEIERELFYPALEGRVDPGLIGHALAEHDHIEAELEKVASLDPDDEAFPAAFASLAGHVHAHLFEEERSMLPAADAIDRAALGERMAMRKAARMAEQQGVD